MYQVYLIRSLARPDKSYVGFTEQSIDDRITDHNCGRVPHSAKFKPWTFVACITVPDKKKAMDIERYFKSGSGHAFAHRHLW